MRTNKQLLELMLENIGDFKYNGICIWATEMLSSDLITLWECEKLSRFLRQNLPKKSRNTTSNYRWPVLETAPRIKWIKSQIKKLSK